MLSTYMLGISNLSELCQFQVCRIQKFNMKCEIERMEIIYERLMCEKDSYI